MTVTIVKPAFALIVSMVLFSGCLAPTDPEVPPPAVEQTPPPVVVGEDRIESWTGTLAAPNPLLFMQALEECSVLFEGLEGIHHARHTITTEAPGLVIATLTFAHPMPSITVNGVHLPDVDLLLFDAEGNLVKDANDDACGASTTSESERFIAYLAEPGEYAFFVANFAAVQADYTLVVEIMPMGHATIEIVAEP
jgi:hypothetical protein